MSSGSMTFRFVVNAADLFSDRFRHSLSTDPESRNGFGPYLTGVGPAYKDRAGIVRTIRYGHIEDLRQAFDYHGKNVAAILLEPIQGEAGYVRSIACSLSFSDETSEASSFHQRGIFGKCASCARRRMCSLFVTKSRRSVHLPATMLSDADHRGMTTRVWHVLGRCSAASTRVSDPI